MWSGDYVCVPAYSPLYNEYTAYYLHLVVIYLSQGCPIYYATQYRNIHALKIILAASGGYRSVIEDVCGAMDRFNI